MPIALAGLLAAVGCLVAVPPPPSARRPRRLGWPAPPSWPTVPPAYRRAAAGALVLVLVGAPAPLALAALVGTAVWWAGSQRRARLAAARSETTSRAVADLAGALAAELLAGRPPTAALADLAEELRGADDPARAALAFEMTRVAGTAELGGDVAAVLVAAGRSPGAGALSDLAAGWRVAEETGAGLAAVLGEVAAGIRRDLAARRRVATSLAAARASARLLMVLPAFGLVLGLGLGVSPLSFLLGPWPGRVCLVTGLGLCALGGSWTERIAAGPRPSRVLE